MTTVIAVHDVDDVDHWLKSSKRAKFFKAHGMSVQTFVSPHGGNRVGVLIQNVPSLETLMSALQTSEAAAAMKSDGVHPDSIQIYLSS